ncbi:MAG: cation-translocating P-type ATPase C-terminal domain-containing protein [Bacillota bacterium]|nr:cation-translocating P-type ATPase C-terminal domain-containing protein [Bacillota bacterium]
MGLSLLQGASVLAAVLTVFAVALFCGQGGFEARTLTFATLLVANVGLILTNRSWSRTVLATLRTPNAALWWVVWGALAFLRAVLYLPALRAVFHFTFLHPADLLYCLGAGVASLLWFEALKVRRRVSQ